MNRSIPVKRWSWRHRRQPPRPTRWDVELIVRWAHFLADSQENAGLLPAYAYDRTFPPSMPCGLTEFSARRVELVGNAGVRTRRVNTETLEGRGVTPSEAEQLTRLPRHLEILPSRDDEGPRARGRCAHIAVRPYCGIRVGVDLYAQER